MKKYIACLGLLLIFGCKENKKMETEEETSVEEEMEMAKTEEEWEILFDGCSFDGWHV